MRKGEGLDTSYSAACMSQTLGYESDTLPQHHHAHTHDPDANRLVTLPPYHIPLYHLYLYNGPIVKV